MIHKIGNKELKLYPEKAAMLGSDLLIADTHFGKAAAFRSKGVFVPSGTTQDDLSKLSNLIYSTKADRLIILGDFIHARESKKPELMEKLISWRNKFSQLQIDLIKGNHDRASGLLPKELNISIHNEIEIENVLLTHEPEEVEGKYVLCGHIHPGVRIQAPIYGSYKFPCFYFSQYYGIFPAYGGFTGKYLINPQKKDTIYAIVEEKIIKL